jgi:hypothetical protein
MKVSRSFLIPVVAIAVSVVTPASALAATAIPARTVSLDSSTLQLRRAAADVVAGFRMPRSAAAAVHPADTAGTSVPNGPSPEIVPDGTVPPDAAGSEFTDCAAEPHDGLCLWENAGYKGNFWYYDSNTKGTLGYSHNEWYYVGGYDNDKASSIYNHRTEGTLVSKSAPPSMPDEVCIIHSAAYGNLTAYAWPDPNHSTMNDSISSFNFVSSPDC